MISAVDVEPDSDIVDEKPTTSLALDTDLPSGTGALNLLQ